jgi:hypothetical protein
MKGDETRWREFDTDNDRIDLEVLKNERRNKKKQKGKQGDALLAEDMKNSLVDVLAPEERMPEPVGQPEVLDEVQENQEGIQKPVWYPGIVKDLREAISLKVFSQEHKEAVERLRSSGVRLPEVIWNEDAPVEMTVEKNLQRTKIGSALDQLFEERAHGSRWGTREAAVQYLREELKVGKSATDKPRENLGIDKNGVDKYKEDHLDKSEKKGLDNEKKAEEMSLEDKIERVKNSGGTLVETYKRYVLSGIKPDNFDYVISQVKQAFPFDVVELAEEWKRKIKEEGNNMSKAEPEAESWEVTYENNVLFQSLKRVADKEMWQKKVEELSKLDEVTRENKLSILMALIKIKSEGIITVEGQRLWDRKKSRLEELGLMI